jgi:hypothetical protein
MPRDLDGAAVGAEYQPVSAAELAGDLSGRVRHARAIQPLVRILGVGLEPGAFN